MPTNAPKNIKTGGGLDNFYVNDWKNGGKIGMETLHLVSRHLQRSDWGLIWLRKQM